MTIYDLEVEATWKGKVGEEEVKGKVRVPEVSHEAIDGLSEYQVSIPIPPSFFYFSSTSTGIFYGC